MEHACRHNANTDIDTTNNKYQPIWNPIFQLVLIKAKSEHLHWVMSHLTGGSNMME